MSYVAMVTVCFCKHLRLLYYGPYVFIKETHVNSYAEMPLTQHPDGNMEPRDDYVIVWENF